MSLRGTICGILTKECQENHGPVHERIVHIRELQNVYQTFQLNHCTSLYPIPKYLQSFFTAAPYWRELSSLDVLEHKPFSPRTFHYSKARVQHTQSAQ